MKLIKVSQSNTFMTGGNSSELAMKTSDRSLLA